MLLKDAMFERAKEVLEQHVSTSVLHTADIRTLAEHEGEKIAVRLAIEVIEHKFCDETIKLEYSTPATWWEMFKRDVLKIKKIKEQLHIQSYRITERLVFPKAQIGPHTRHMFFISGQISSGAYVGEDVLGPGTIRQEVIDEGHEEKSKDV